MGYKNKVHHYGLTQLSISVKVESYFRLCNSHWLSFESIFEFATASLQRGSVMGASFMANLQLHACECWSTFPCGGASLRTNLNLKAANYSSKKLLHRGMQTWIHRPAAFKDNPRECKLHDLDIFIIITDYEIHLNIPLWGRTFEG